MEVDGGMLSSFFICKISSVTEQTLYRIVYCTLIKKLNMIHTERVFNSDLEISNNRENPGIRER